ncbi:hypothetical protein [Tardiphaga sp. 709]|uniref:hypothetical protein n=1 Tax=Tardiphaga sp. 709 TaxID=3076039 RepID=UPI0028F0CC49|nr:hypothetical protein [Tardiphaga sp. 709]WNV09965.1 hypothetical protein RSO67_01850 [Tardiphaga sp. 709]
MTVSSAKNEPKDIKPPVERKEQDWKSPGTADANNVPRADESAIGSPDVFLKDAHKDTERTKVYQVWADGAKRGYVVHDASMATSKVGYFELAEGMNKAEADEALAHAYDNTAVAV